MIGFDNLTGTATLVWIQHAETHFIFLKNNHNATKYVNNLIHLYNNH
jgi:hypothetical protein